MDLKKLRRYPDEAYLGGVCAGLAYSLKLPTWLIRFIVALMIYFGYGSPGVVYVILWIVLQPYETPRDYNRRTGD